VAPAGAVRDEWPVDDAEPPSPAASATAADTDVHVIAAPEWRDVSPNTPSRNEWVRRNEEPTTAAPSKLDI
jgi:hypothetical protein